MSKITKICNFALSGMRKIGQKALILAILEDFGKPKMVKITKICNFALSGIRKIGQKTLILAISDVFGKPKMVKNHSAILRFPESAK